MVVPGIGPAQLIQALELFCPPIRTQRRSVASVAVALVLGFFLLSGAKADGLPSLGSLQGGAITPAQERDIGRTFLKRAQKKLHFLRDPAINSFIRQIGQRLVAQTDFVTYPFHFYVIESPRMNAFAVPGGHIFLHTQLIRATESVDELAGVLAHEIAHITQRHMARTVSAGKQTQLSSLLLMIAGLFAGIQGQGEAAQALVVGSGAFAQSKMLAYSRAHEREADRLGLRFLARAGFSAYGLPHFLKRLQSWSQLQGHSPVPYASTHPLTHERIAEARDRAAQWAETGHATSPPKATAAFRRMQVRLRVTTASSFEKAWSHFNHRVEGNPEDSVARYGRALAAQRSGRRQQAIKDLKALVTNHPEVVAYRATLGEFLLQNNRAEEAIVAFQATLERHPNDPALRERLGQAYLAAGQADRARVLLEEVTRDYPGRASGHELLARTYSHLGRPIAAHQANAQAQWLQGQPTEAIAQLRVAARLARERNDPALAQIRARIRELKSSATSD